MSLTPSKPKAPPPPPNPPVRAQARSFVSTGGQETPSGFGSLISTGAGGLDRSAAQPKKKTLIGATQ